MERLINAPPNHFFETWNTEPRGIALIGDNTRRLYCVRDKEEDKPDPEEC